MHSATLRSLNIRHRLWLIMLSVVVILTLIASASLFTIYTSLLAEKQNQTKYMVDIAYGILNSTYNDAIAKNIDTNTAQQNAMQQISTLRYDGNNYFWIHNMQAKMLMHPINTALNNTDMSDYKDPAGKRFLVDMATLVKEKGEGMMPYLWPKPGVKNPVDKISYVKGFEKWGWILGTGIYVDDVNAKFWQIAGEIGLIAGVCLAILLIILHIITRSIELPILKTLQTINGIDGNLTKRLDTDGNDEMSKLCKGFNYFLIQIHAMVLLLKKSSSSINSSSSQLLTVCRDNQNIIEQQHTQTQSVATAITEMSATIKEVARNAQDAANAASKADKEAKCSKEIVAVTAQSILELANAVEQSSNVVNNLEAKSKSIGSVVDVIQNISEQTNLLALNAAIEAARAGEQGRGFAVVADEVRTLATRTQQSTREIQKMIEELQIGSKEAVQVMEESHVKTKATVGKALKATESLDNIVAAIKIIHDINGQIASTTEEQSVVAQDIDQRINDIAQLSENTSRSSERMRDLSMELKKLDEIFQSGIQQFKTE